MFPIKKIEFFLFEQNVFKFYNLNEVRSKQIKIDTKCLATNKIKEAINILTHKMVGDPFQRIQSQKSMVVCVVSCDRMVSSHTKKVAIPRHVPS